jgi:hypothetical protein
MVTFRRLRQGVDQQESGCQTRRAAMLKARRIPACVRNDPSRATLLGGLRRDFSAACFE